MPTGTLLDGRSPHAELHSHLYRMPVLASLTYLIGGPLIGLARKALEIHVERTGVRREIYTGRAKGKSVGAQMRVAESSAEITAAELLLDKVGDGFDALVAARELPTIEQRAELKWHATYAAELCRRAAERIFAGAGAHAAYDANVLRRPFRDYNTCGGNAEADSYGNVKR